MMGTENRVERPVFAVLDRLYSVVVFGEKTTSHDYPPRSKKVPKPRDTSPQNRGFFWAMGVFMSAPCSRGLASLESKSESPWSSSFLELGERKGEGTQLPGAAWGICAEVARWAPSGAGCREHHPFCVQELPKPCA